MDAFGITFMCDQCGREFRNRWPVRHGNGFFGFCSFPCAWAFAAARGNTWALAAIMRWSEMGGNLANLAFMGKLFSNG